MADLEPASALAHTILDTCADDEPTRDEHAGLFFQHRYSKAEQLIEADRAAVREQTLREADEAIAKRIEAEEKREAKMPPGEPESITQSAAVCGLEWARHELAALLTGGKTHG